MPEYIPCFDMLLMFEDDISRSSRSARSIQFLIMGMFSLTLALRVPHGMASHAYWAL